MLGELRRIMEKQQVVDVTKVIVESANDEEINIFTVYAVKFKQLKINVKARKLIAKELSASEQAALRWKTVQDVFSFIDISTFAKEHPKEAAALLKKIVGIIGIVYPIVIPFTSIVIALPTKKAAELVEWLGKPTPEHMLYNVAQYKARGVNDVRILEELTEKEQLETKKE